MYKFSNERLCPKDIERLLSRTYLQLSIGRLLKETQRIDGIFNLQRNFQDDGHSAHVHSLKTYPSIWESADQPRRLSKETLLCGRWKPEGLVH